MWWNSPCRRAKGPRSSQDFWGMRCWKTALCIMGYVTKRPTISFVNLFSPPPPHTHTHRHSKAILLLSSATSCASFHACAASWRVERTQAAEGPAARHMDQMKSESLRRYGLLMEDWLVTTGVLGGCGGGKEMRACTVGCTCVFKASLKLSKKEKKTSKKWQKNNTGQKFYLPIFACTLEFHSYFFPSLSNQSFSVQQ